MDEPRPAVIVALPPTRTVALVRRVANPVWLRVGISSELQVTGRRTGAPVRVTVVPVEVEGRQYVVSFAGTSHWVRNLRASTSCGLRRKGRPGTFIATEIAGPERDAAIAAYRARLPGPFRRDFDRRPAADDHPVFRVDRTGSA